MRIHSRPLFILLVLGVWGVITSNAAFAEEWPVLKQGMWQYDRAVTMAGQAAPLKTQFQKCSDPVAEIKATNAQLASHCKPFPETKAGNVYSFGADCTTPGGRSISKTELTAAGEGGYALKVTTETGGMVIKEELTAKRVGECP